MPNGTKLPTMGLFTLPITIVGQTHHVEVYVTRVLPTDLILGLPAMSKMGAVIDTSNLTITLKTDPHRSLKIQMENGVRQEVYTAAEHMLLPPHSESLVLVHNKAHGLSPKMGKEEWRELTPYFSTERYRQLLIAPGVAKGPVKQVLVANLSGKQQPIYKGTRMAIGRKTAVESVQCMGRERPSGLYE